MKGPVIRPQQILELSKELQEAEVCIIMLAKRQNPEDKDSKIQALSFIAGTDQDLLNMAVNTFAKHEDLIEVFQDAINFAGEKEVKPLTQKMREEFKESLKDAIAESPELLEFTKQTLEEVSKDGK